MIVFGEAHLRRILRRYAAYYNVSRTHRSVVYLICLPYTRARERFFLIQLTAGRHGGHYVDQLTLVKIAPTSLPLRLAI